MNNSARLTGDEVAGNVTAAVGKTIGKDVLRKKVSFDGGNTATWRVDVNRNHAVITTPEGTDSIGISDTLQKGLVYLSDSLKVSQVDFDEGGTASNRRVLTESADYKVDYNETARTLSITWLKMSKMTESYQVEFQTQVLVSGTYHNTVQFFGVASGNYDSEAGSKTWRLFSGGGAKPPSGSGMLRIIKTDGTTKKALDGLHSKMQTTETADSGEQAAVPTAAFPDFLRQENADLAAWLTVPGTEVDYPVMLTPDDMESYMHRDFRGNYSACGTPFFDTRCAPLTSADTPAAI